MKKLLFILFILLSTNLFAGEFEAVAFKDQNILAIRVSDSLIPPFEAGEFWKIMKGSEYRKSIVTKNFKMECVGQADSSGEILGECIILVALNQFQKIDQKLVYKLTGGSAANLNRYFTDSAYVAIQRGKVYLSSYNTRRQFFFAIDEDLIKR